MSTEKEKIKLPILLPLGLAFLILLCASVVSIYWLQQQNINSDVQTCLTGVRQMFEFRLDEDAELLNGLLDFIEMDNNLQSAWLTENRDALLHHAKRFFKEINTKYRVTHFYFYRPDKTCFLRVHNPSVYGDYINTFTLNQAVRKGKNTHGIELGPLGSFTLRVVHPWRINGKLAGYVELGEQIEHITPQLKEILNAELIFTINKFLLDRNKWKQGTKALNRSETWDQFSHFVVIDHTMDEIPAKLKKHISYSPAKYENSLFSISYQGRYYRGGYVHLIDAGGRDVGDIIVLSDVTDKQASQMTLSAALIAFCVVVAVLLLLLFFLYIHRIEFKLVKGREYLQTEIQERKRTELALKKAKERAEQTQKEIRQINRQLKVSVRQANQLAQQAVAADLTKSQFLANMSHEIRTPMNAIIGFGDILAEGELSQEQKNHIDLIRQSSKSLLRLINDILDFSKIEAGKLETEHIDYSLGKLLTTVQSLTQSAAKKKGLQFEIRPGENLPAIIRTDPVRLHQCLVNLINNAIKFTEEGHIFVDVFLEGDGNHHNIHFDIEDTGIGIPLDKQQSIFDAFIQADGATTRKYGGSGLGLAITKKLANLLNGELTLKSEVGKGSVFTLTIPAGVDINSQPLIDDKHDFVEEPKTKPVFPNNEELSGKVLVAEDSKTNQTLIRLLLEKMGLKVTIAENGAEAVDKALAESFDIIFMDIHMPVMNGYDAIKKLRENGLSNPIIALTANAMKGDEEKYLAAGCTDYLAKPIDRQRLVKIVHKYLLCKSTA